MSTGAAFSLIGFCVNVLVFGTAFSSVAIAEDLRQPLWWLGADGLRQRLYVWTFATSWRTALSITAAIALSALGFNACWLVVLAPVLGIGIAWLLRAVGLGTYALVPSPVDERGPLVFVKSFVLVGLVVPAIAAGLVIALLLAGHRIPNAAPIATLAALLVGTAESVALIELARRRFAGDGARFGLIAQR